jgi:hypothetical protein
MVSLIFVLVDIDMLLISDSRDPVTGLGTPNFPQLLQLFLSLP